MVADRGSVQSQPLAGPVAEPLAPALARDLWLVEESAARLALAGAKDLHELLEQARAQARATQRASATLVEMRAQSDGATANAQAALESAREGAAAAGSGSAAMAEIRTATRTTLDAVSRSEKEVANVVGASARIEGIVKLIERIAAQTNMLALNATIESARAGVHGRGFAVVAAEVRKLSQDTAARATEINAVVQEMRKAADQVGALVHESRAQAEQAARAGELGERSINDLIGVVTAATVKVEEIAGAARNVSAAAAETAGLIEEVGAQAQSTLARTERAFGSEDVQGATEAIFSVLGRNRYGGQLEQMLTLARSTAAQAEEILEAAMREAGLSPEGLLDFRYQEAKGPLVARFSRLFDVSRVPEAGFSPAKYLTSWDHLIDVPIRELVDRQLKSDPRVVNLAVPDLNGYHYTHLSRHCQGWTSDPKRDGPGNRVKRIFDNQVELRGARVGIPDGMRAPRRAALEQFRAAGVDPDALDGPAPFLLQTYSRDTGEVIHDLSVPVFLAGRRFGGVRLCFKLDAEAARPARDEPRPRSRWLSRALAGVLAYVGPVASS